MTDGPLLWYLNRATGVTLLVLLTLVLVLGMVAARGRAGGRVPAFATQAVHRRLAAVAAGLLVAHVAAAVLDTFVTIRWWEAVVPFVGDYRPLWLGLGALALDVGAVVVVSSLARARLGHRGWRALHLTAYAAWALSVVHGLGTGSDQGVAAAAAGAWWGLPLTLGCVAVVAATAVWRVAGSGSGMTGVGVADGLAAGPPHDGGGGMTSPVPVPRRVDVRPGPLLLAGIDDGPSLAAHRDRWGAPAGLDVDALVAACAEVDLRGRGGAGFPFARKLATADRHSRPGNRPSVVVNLAEGEPASAKDHALALHRPHLVLDGAAAAARALRARTVDVVLPGERPAVGAAVGRAVAERAARRAGERVRWRLRRAEPRFVSGQESAVLELLDGREGLPVTTWRPATVRGPAGRPALLSNAETWAHVGVLALAGTAAVRRLGTPDEPGTRLLTLAAPDRAPRVVEVPQGTRLADVVGPAAGGPLLLGGFHGSWVARAGDLRVSASSAAAHGVSLGAGVVLVPAAGGCPVDLTAAVVRHLAGESAGRCGPCVLGLPALAGAVEALAAGAGSAEACARGAGLVAGRGACAHPDGTARLVASLLRALPEEVARHEQGACGVAAARGAAAGVTR